MKINNIITLSKSNHNIEIDIVSNRKLKKLYGAGGDPFDFFSGMDPGDGLSGDSGSPDPTDGPCPQQQANQGHTLPTNWPFTEPAVYLGSGSVTFVGFTNLQVQSNFALIPEEGTQLYNPNSNGYYYGVDGFYLNPLIGDGNLTTYMRATLYWFKIPNGASVMVTPSTDGTGLPIITVLESLPGEEPSWQNESLAQRHDDNGNPYGTVREKDIQSVNANCCTDISLDAGK